MSEDDSERTPYWWAFLKHPVNRTVALGMFAAAVLLSLPWGGDGFGLGMIALARALVLRPKVLLMDEPFGALDAQTRSNMQALLIRLHQAHPCVVVFVTHDVTEALLLGERVIVLSTQPARIIDDFPVVELQPRSADWLASAAVRQLHERVVGHLRASSGGRGNVRVTV